MGSLNQIIIDRCGILAPRDNLKVSEWAAKRLELDGGKFRAFAMQREIMDSLCDPTLGEAVFVKSAQIGGTTILDAMTGFCIEHEPSKILVVQQTVEMGESWSQSRLQTMADRSFPNLIGKPRSRDSKNTTLHKVFPGGDIVIVGANSSASLSSRDRDRVFLDDTARYPESAGEDGDPEFLARKRTAAHPNAFIFSVSTPNIKRTILGPDGNPVTLPSRIFRSYLLTDQRRWFCQCPRCGQWDTLHWTNALGKYNVVWPEGKPEQAVYVPDCCGAELTDAERLKMAVGGEWRKTADIVGKAGFWINGLASPFAAHRGYVSKLHEYASDWLASQKESDKLQVFINTTLGEDFEQSGERPDIKPLFDRRERFDSQTMPNGVQVLTAFCDVQHNRLEITVCGWGYAEECWVIEHRVIHGAVTAESTWQQLDAEIQAEYVRQDEKILKIGCLLVDSGDGKTQKEVYSFCSPRQYRRIYASKGSNDNNAPLTRLSPPTKHAKTRGNIYLVTIGSSVAKGTLLTRLKINAPGRCYIHFSDSLTVDWFNQLASEEYKEKKSGGRIVGQWVQVSDRNEALDCMAGNIAAFAILRPQLKAPTTPTVIQTPTATGAIDQTPVLTLLSTDQPKHQMRPRRPSKFDFTT